MNTNMQNPAFPLEAQEARNDDEIDLREYWQVLRNQRWLILGVTAAVLATALVLTLLATPIYRATSMLQIERDSLQVVNVEGVIPTESGPQNDFYTTQYELLKSESLAQRVAENLGLAQHPQFAKRLEEVGADLPAAQQKQARDRAVSRALLDDLTIAPVRNSRLVRVNFDSPDPPLAARVANAWGDAFIAATLERRLDASSYARQYLEERLAQTKARLEDSEKELVQFASDEEIVSVGDDKPSLSAQNLSDLNASLAKAQDERIQAEAAWNQASQGSGLGLPQVVENQLIQRLRESRSQVAAEYQDKLGTFKPEYPDMQRLQGQIREYDRQIASEVGNIRNSVKARYDAALAQEQLLQQRIQGLKGDVLDLQNRSIQYNIIRRDADTNRELYNALLQRYKEIGVAGGVGANNISIVDRAQVPQNRFKPSLARNLAIALLLGLMLGVLLAFGRHFLDRSLHSPQAVEGLIGRPVLGIIPRLAQNTSPEQASTDLRSPFSEAYRSVRTALQFATAHGLPHTLLITSASASEGKSTTARELSRNIAQLGKRVLLVDADLRNPSIHRLTGLSNSVGLSSVLSGAAEPMAAVQPGKEPNLSVITSGPLPPNPPELLAGEGLGRMLESLGGQFDVIVLDGPPVLGLADAPLLAHQVESTILVATADKTRSDSLAGAFKRLQSAQANVIGAVLTQFDLNKGSDYGYGGYTYYSYGGKPD